MDSYELFHAIGMVRLQPVASSFMEYTVFVILVAAVLLATVFTGPCGVGAMLTRCAALPFADCWPLVKSRCALGGCANGKAGVDLAIEASLAAECCGTSMACECRAGLPEWNL